MLDLAELSQELAYYIAELEDHIVSDPQKLELEIHKWLSENFIVKDI